MLLLQNIKNVPVQFSVRAFSTTNCSLAKRWKDKYAKDYESGELLIENLRNLRTFVTIAYR